MQTPQSRAQRYTAPRLYLGKSQVTFLLSDENKYHLLDSVHCLSELKLSLLTSFW